MHPQISYGAPILAQKNIKSLQLLQNTILISIFKNCLSPSITTAEKSQVRNQIVENQLYNPDCRILELKKNNKTNNVGMLQSLKCASDMSHLV